ncbi:molybdopterin molybdotransferase MoeA [Undibacterium fentianense]|uniref:Molybdopterin molybdenumtransferase n=1 Tax=Undibacterium fentianense TaxID=2828728 RepID=A0A941IDV9_9BURK|nr:gephyrin-like molybdotransferase Glp [Undibacterium fentianense]MBR7798991.1 molybdopterin molybdenumtransferase MoeA [Undibacterium fentianense]
MQKQNATSHDRDALFSVKNHLSVEQARTHILNKVSPLTQSEVLPLHLCIGRTLARDILSPMDVPPHDNSAMDGYAFLGDCDPLHEQIQLRVIGTATAGHPFTDHVPIGCAIQIMTGAVMPHNCDTVIPQELCLSISDTSITLLTRSTKPGSNRRLRGEDLQQGKVALQKGQRIGPAELGLIASLGIDQVTVNQRLKVACFSTGDELRDLGQHLDLGCVYDSNRYTLLGMLQRLDCDVLDMGLVPDDPSELESSLRRACLLADVIITSGGVSVGGADFTKQVLAKLGNIDFWSINMRPGKPMAFGEIQSDGQSAFLFGLPGNPVAVMVTFYFFVKQALQRMMGQNPQTPILIPAICRQNIQKRPGRTEFQRGIVQQRNDGILEVDVTGMQGSGILRSMSEANCLIVISEDKGPIDAGSTVQIVLLDGLV